MIIAGLRQSVRTSIQKNDTSMFLSPNKTQTTGGLSREAARLGIKTKNVISKEIIFRRHR